MYKKVVMYVVLYIGCLRSWGKNSDDTFFTPPKFFVYMVLMVLVKTASFQKLPKFWGTNLPVFKLEYFYY